MSTEVDCITWQHATKTYKSLNLDRVTQYKYKCMRLGRKKTTDIDFMELKPRKWMNLFMSAINYSFLSAVIYVDVA